MTSSSQGAAHRVLIWKLFVNVGITLEGYRHDNRHGCKSFILDLQTE